MTLHSYALIDGVKRQTAIKEIYTSKEPIQVIPLYMGTRFQDVYDLGPILVASINGGIIQKLQQDDWPKSTSFITTEQPLSVVAEHLKQFTTIQSEAGSEVIFRFADPLVTYYWLNSYDDPLSNIMGPIQTWQVAKPQQAWYPDELEWHTFTNANTPVADFPLNQLGDPQMRALELAEGNRFNNKLYLWLVKENPAILEGKTPDEFSIWLNDAVNGARDFNLNTERTYALWVDLCADYGQDFATNPKGAYQQWLTDNPEQKKLPADVKITNFHRYINQ